VQSGGSRSRLSTAVDLAAWTIVAGVGIIVLTQEFGWAVTPLVVVAQSLTPYLGVVVIVVALVALWTRRLLMTTVAAAIGFGIVVLGTPLAVPDDQPDPIDGAAELEVASVNLLFTNDRIADVAEQMDQLTADVIVFTEYTAQHQAALLASPVAERYPYRTDRAGPRGEGVAIWSAMPVEVVEHPDTDSTSIDVTVSGPDGAIRVVAVHFPTPLDDFASWSHDLREAAEIGRSASGPTLLIGDFNASYWHPDFRSVLDAGFVDAHTATDAGFSTSWPTSWPIPPFVRLDHALTAGGLVATDVEDFDVAGSDHLGMIVTVAPTPPAAP
jgi:endonuclease/exonuclease/phosphatase (EEP) superfamily protein YafD